MSNSLAIGVDEAGRGAVIGPLVLAACAMTKREEILLLRAGLNDSKSFGPPNQAQHKRAKLALLIIENSTWQRIVAISPATVDEFVKKRGLNVLEREVALDLLRDIPSEARVFLDGHRLFDKLQFTLSHAIAQDKADQSIPCVAAASILAKTERDRLFSMVRSRYEGTFGKIAGEGYPNAATARFLGEFVRRMGKLPEEVRMSWRWPPLSALQKEISQQSSFSAIDRTFGWTSFK